MEVPRRDTLARLPLAEAVLTLWRWVADAGSLDQIFDDNRGRCYEKILSFSLLVYLVRDALLEYGGSGRKSFDEAKDRGELETSYPCRLRQAGADPHPREHRHAGRVYRPAPRGLSRRAAGPDPAAGEPGRLSRSSPSTARPSSGWPSGSSRCGASPAACWADGPWSPWTCAAAWPWPCAPIPTAMPTRSASWAIWCPKCGDSIPGKTALARRQLVLRPDPAGPLRRAGGCLLGPLSSQGPVLRRPGVAGPRGARRPGSALRRGVGLTWAARGTRSGCTCGGSPCIGPARRT